MPLTPEEQEEFEARFQALEERNAKLDRLIRSGKAFTNNPLALATDLDDLGSVKTHLDFEEPTLTPINPPADVVRLYAVDASGATRLITRNAAGVGVTRYMWVSLFDWVVGTGTPTQIAVGAWSVGTRVWSFPNSGVVDGIMGAKMALPADWVSGTVEATAFVQGAASSTNNYNVQMHMSTLTPGTDSINKAQDSSETKTIADSTVLTAITFSSGVLTVAAGDIIRLTFLRDSSHGDDTNVDALLLAGVRLAYTAFL